MKKNQLCVIMFLVINLPAISQIGNRTTSAFTPGNLVVYRVGDGSTALSTAAVPVFLDEYTPAGSLVQSIALPTVVNAPNQILTASGSNPNEGYLNLSVDKRFIVMTGYNAAIGTAAVTSTTAAVFPRVIGLVKYDGTINTSTALTNFSSGGPVWSAVSVDGSAMWGVGSGSASSSGGLRYALNGATTTVQIATATSYRVLNITSNQLYSSRTTGAATGGKMGTVGSGLPTTGTQTFAVLPGDPGSDFPNQFAFADLDPNVAGFDVFYATEGSSTSASAIYKWSLVGGVWTPNGSIGTETDNYRGLTISVTGTTVTIYATRGAGATATPASGGGDIVTLTDASGYNATITGTISVLASAGNQTSFRGISFVPTSSCTGPSITAHPSSTSICQGNTALLTVTATGDATLSYQWYTGTSGDLSNPIGGATSNSYTTPALSSSANYWVKVTNGCGSANSTTATVNVYTSATWTGAVNNDYNTAGNWNTNCIPSASMDIVIPSGNPTITATTVAIHSVTLQSGATLNLNDGAVLNVTGDFTNNGTIISGGSPADAKIIFSGTALQNINGTGIFSYVEVSNAVDVFVLSNITAKSMVTLTGARLTVVAPAEVTIIP